MITSGMWLSDQIVDAGQKLLKSTYPNIQGLQEVALGMVLSYSIAKSEFIQIMNTGKHHWVTSTAMMKRYMSMTVHQLVLYIKTYTNQGVTVQGVSRVSPQKTL